MNLDQRTKHAATLLPKPAQCFSPPALALLTELGRSTSTSPWAHAGPLISTAGAMLGPGVRVQVAPGSSWKCSPRTWCVATAASGTGKSLVHDKFETAVRQVEAIKEKEMVEACPSLSDYNFTPMVDRAVSAREMSVVAVVDLTRG
jgi:hypothetical protein